MEKNMAVNFQFSIYNYQSIFNDQIFKQNELIEN